MDKKEVVFADGMFFSAPDERTKEKAPWIKGKLSFKVATAIALLQKHENNAGYVNVDLKKSKGGKLYLEVNTWQPEKKEDKQGPVPTEVDYPEEELEGLDEF